jgi:hypothetical protein
MRDAKQSALRAACQPVACPGYSAAVAFQMIRKLPSGKWRLYSRKVDPNTKRRKNLGTFESKEAAQKHERAVQFFKRHK